MLNIFSGEYQQILFKPGRNSTDGEVIYFTVYYRSALVDNM